VLKGLVFPFTAKKAEISVVQSYAASMVCVFAKAFPLPAGI